MSTSTLRGLASTRATKALKPGRAEKTEVSLRPNRTISPRMKQVPTVMITSTDVTLRLNNAQIIGNSSGPTIRLVILRMTFSAPPNRGTISATAVITMPSTSVITRPMRTNVRSAGRVFSIGTIIS